MVGDHLRKWVSLTPDSAEAIETHVDLNPLYPVDVQRSLNRTFGHPEIKDYGLRPTASFFIDITIRSTDGSVVVKSEELGHIFTPEDNSGVAVVLIPQPRTRNETGENAFNAVTVVDSLAPQSTEKFCIQAVAQATFSLTEQSAQQAQSA